MVEVSALTEVGVLNQEWGGEEAEIKWETPKPPQGFVSIDVPSRNLGPLRDAERRVLHTSFVSTKDMRPPPGPTTNRIG